MAYMYQSTCRMFSRYRCPLSTAQDGLGLPLEVLAVGREMALAYKLLEGSGLKVGDREHVVAADCQPGDSMLSDLLILPTLPYIARCSSSAPGRHQPRYAQPLDACC